MTRPLSHTSGLPLISRYRARLLIAGACTLGAFSHPVSAQDESPPTQSAEQTESQPDESDGEVGSDPRRDIVVQGLRTRGQLLVDQAPLLELDEQDITAEGVTSIADLVTQITDQAGSARGRGSGGRPVILVNGIRIGSFRELAQYPPEALEKVEVFPEEVAQRFGFAPDRRVINLILKENYSSREVELEFEGPASGEYIALEQELGYLQIADGGRFNVNFEARDISLATEDDLGVIQTEGSVSDIATDPDQGEFRSLIADTLSLEGSVSWAKTMIESGTSLGANLNYARNQSRSLSGLNSVTLTDASGNSEFRTFGENDPLERRTSTDTYSIAGSLTRSLGIFRLTTTVDASLTDSETEIDNRFDTQEFEDAALAGTLALDGPLPQDADAGFAVASTRSWSAAPKATVRGPIAVLPAGDVNATIDLGYGWNRIESADTRSLQDTQLTRGDMEAGLNLVLPLTSRREQVADALGSFTLNLQAGINELSDFGTLTDWSVGLNWAPFDNLDLSATYIRREVAPSLSNLGSPETVTFNSPVFDFTTGETVLATVISGGNPDLLAETQADWKFGANWQLPFWSGTRFRVEYIRNRSDDVTSGFPTLTDDIEAAFSDRVTRDADGVLTELDRRPVTFAETRADRLQFSLSARGRWGQPSRGSQQKGGRPGRAGAGGPPAGPSGAGLGRPRRPQGQPPGGGRPDRAPPTEEQRAQFMQFRERICAEGGLEVLTRLATAVENGQDLSGVAPGFDPQRFERILSRVRDENGEITPERLAQFRERFCSVDPSMFGARGGPPSAQGAPQGRPGGGPPRNPLASGFGRDGSGRYFFNLTHTVELKSEILIANGVPLLDQLDGDSTSAFGTPRHTSRLEAGIFRNGMGLRLSGRYTGEARINGSDAGTSTDLFFGDLVTFDLRLFADIGAVTGQESGFLKNFRVALRADNVFDARRSVRDANGDTPINFQSSVIDPTGLFVGIDLRKLF
ncbi:MAG: hypothetical protein AAGK02_13850 [Pseudomonadota bacterium]